MTSRLSRGARWTWHPSCVLIVIAGLPASGKSTVAGDLARALKCAVLGVDPVEAALWRAGISAAQPTHHAAYLAVEALAAEQLMVGHHVIVDAVNGPEAARARWRSLADRLRVELRFVEVLCSDDALYKARLSRRTRHIEGFPEPTWEGVLQRRAEFPPWTGERLVLDSVNDRHDNLKRALRYLDTSARWGRPATAEPHRPARLLRRVGYVQSRVLQADMRIRGPGRQPSKAAWASAVVDAAMSPGRRRSQSVAGTAVQARAVPPIWRLSGQSLWLAAPNQIGCSVLADDVVSYLLLPLGALRIAPGRPSDHIT